MTLAKMDSKILIMIENFVMAKKSDGLPVSIIIGPANEHIQLDSLM
jgi:hypothetical protein